MRLLGAHPSRRGPSRPWRVSLCLLALACSAALAGPALGASGTATVGTGATSPPAGLPTPTGTGQVTSTPATGSPLGAPANTSTVPANTSTVPGRAGTKAQGKGSGKLSDGAILAAILGGLIALACLVWAVFRFGAFEPHWLLSLRHSLAEAGFRASATWAEFTDWVRLGR
jgi:hypothetical protein